jgi:hypothetical protein
LVRAQRNKFPEQRPPAHLVIGRDVRYIALSIMADPVATQASISDKDLYENMRKLVGSIDSANDRRDIAANVLFAYAKGSLTYGDASDIVVPLVKKLWYKELIDMAWERGKFKALGELRTSYYFLC